MDYMAPPNSEHLAVMPNFDNPTKLAAVAEHMGVTIKISDDFAAYLAKKNNNELRIYLNLQAEEIVRFVASMEKRVSAGC